MKNKTNKPVEEIVIRHVVQTSKFQTFTAIMFGYVLGKCIDVKKEKKGEQNNAD